VALTPEGLATAGAQGFITGGIPGAIQGVALAAVANFAAAARSPRVISFPPGHPKEPLQAPYWLVMRQFQGALGQAVVDDKFGNLSPAEFARIPDKAFDVGRFGGIVIQQIFNQATVEQIKSVINQPAEVILETRRVLEGGDPLSQISQEENMVFNPATGTEQPPERVDRGRYNEGLENELVSKPLAKALAPSIVPTIEIGRFIVHPQVVGNIVAFAANVLVASGGITTLIRIPAKKNRVTYIRRAHFTVSPDGGGIPQYELRGNAAAAASSGIVNKLHFQVLRQSSSLTVGESLADGEVGEFTVPLDLDYIIHLINAVGGPIRVGVNVEGFFIPKGVVGSYC